MEEKFRTELLAILDKKMDKEQINEVDIALTVLFCKYEVVEQCTDLVPVNEQGNEKILKTYIASMRLEGHSDRTLEQYRDAVVKLLEDIPKDFAEIRTNDIRFHLAKYQSTHKVSSVTVDNKRRFLSTFFAWLTAEEIISKNPMLRIKRIKQKKVDKKPFSAAEMEKIRDCLKTSREKALVEFMLSTGCRVSEVAHLRMENIDFRTGECTVLGKGNKERTVYISDNAMYYLQRYLAERSWNASSPLFLNKRGTGMSKCSIEHLVRQIGRRAGVEKVHPHRFRRTMATNAAKRGLPIQYIQAILGHSKIDTTMIYCSVSKESVKEAYFKVA